MKNIINKIYKFIFISLYNYTIMYQKQIKIKIFAMKNKKKVFYF